MDRRNLYPLCVGVLLLLSIGLSFHGVRLGYGTYRSYFPDVGTLKEKYPIVVGKKDGKIFFRLSSKRPTHWRSLNEISSKAIAAIITSEDATFWQHKGYSPEAIRSAIEYNAKSTTKIKRGGSTITQQVVKNIFLSPEKTMIRKVRELLLSMELERRVPKARILEIYLNIAELGPNIYGLEAASWHYFSKPASLLSAREGAILAFMLPNPNLYQRSYREGNLTESGLKQVTRIMERLWKTGKISDEEYAPSVELEDQVSSKE